MPQVIVTLTKKNYNTVVNDCDITDVYVNVIRTYLFEHYFNFWLILIYIFLNNIYLFKAR